MKKKQIVELGLDQIIVDAGTQMRVKTPKYRVQEFAELMKARHKFPPLKVVYDGKNYYLVDGFTRLEAWRLVHGRRKIDCEVVVGTREKARALALSANAEHDAAGLPRTAHDKRKAVRQAEKMFPGRSVRKIAEICKIGKSLVAAMRKEVPAGGRKTAVRADTANAAEVGEAENSGNSNGARPISLDTLLGGDSAPAFGTHPGSEKIAAAASQAGGIALGWPALTADLNFHVTGMSAMANKYHRVLVRLSQLLLDNAPLAKPDLAELTDIRSWVSQMDERMAPMYDITTSGAREMVAEHST